MIDNNQQSDHFGLRPSRPPSRAANHQNDEVELRELLITLWQGKWIVLGVTLLATVIAAAYALKQPNMYQAKATLVLNDSFYSLDDTYQLSLSPYLLTGSGLINVLKDISEDSLGLVNGIGISYDKRDQIFNINKISISPEESFRGVELVLNNLNPILKQIELSKVVTAVNSLSSLNELNSEEQVKSSLAEIYAQQLYKKAVLENPDSQIVQVVSPPVKPTSHIKPKRPLIIVLGVLLGGMLGIAIVLIRFAFRKDQE